MMKTSLRSLTGALTRNSSTIAWTIIAFSLLSLAFGLTSCKDDKEQASDPGNIIKRTWVLSENGYVKKDGGDVTGDYTGLQITFAADGTYTATNAGELFDTPGTWSWKGNSMTELLLNGDFQVLVTVSETDLQMNFTLEEDDLGSGRSASLAGEYDLKLNAGN